MKLGNIIYPNHCDIYWSGGFHFALGQWLVKDERYREMYQHLHQMGDFIMVDNGAAELDEKLVPFKDIVDVCIDWVDEIILPDIFREAEKTIVNTLEYARMVPANKRAICPQGVTSDEWLACFRSIQQEIDFVTVCVPKHTESFEGERLHLVKRLLTHADLEYNIHALGVYRNPFLEITEMSELVYVRSMDTGAAMAWAQAGLSIETLHEPRQTLKQDSLPMVYHDLYSQNVDILTEWCNYDHAYQE